MVEKENAHRTWVQFSPDGEQFILDSGTYVDREYLLYEFDSLKLKKTLYGIALSWLDPVRFVFTPIDVLKGARYADADFPGWLSVVIYDSEAGSFTTLAEATKTEDFMMEEVNNTGEIIITKFSVNDEKDWEDEDAGKIKIEEIRVPVP